MVKLCRLWPGYVNYGLLKLKIRTEFKKEKSEVEKEVENKERKIRSFIALKNFNKTPLGETGCLGNLYFLLPGCLGIQFFDSPPYPNTAQHLRDLQDAMRFHWLPSASHPTPTLDDKYFKHVPKLTYLIYFSPKGVYLVGPIYMPKPLTAFEPAF